MTPEEQFETYTLAVEGVCERMLALENRLVRLEDKMDRILVMFALPPYNKE